MTSFKINVLLAALCAAGSVAAAGPAEVLLTAQHAGKGGSTSYAIDFYSDGNVAGLQFDVDGVGLEKAAVNVGGCLVRPPAGFAGGCTVRDGFVRVLLYSAELKTLPEGWHDLGVVSLRGGAGTPRLKEVLVSDAYGKAIEAGARVAAPK